MQVKESVSEGLKKEFEVLVEKEQVTKTINDKIKKLQKEVKMQGFRPGKIPEAIIKQKYLLSILQEVEYDLLQSTSQQVISERGLKPATQPSIDSVKFKEDSDLEYKISFEVFPEFEIPDFSKITLEKVVCDISDQDFDKYIKIVTQSRKKYKETDKTKAELGDGVLIDYEGFIDGVAFAGGTSQDYQLELGSKSFIDNFEEQLVGSENGQEILVKVRFPDEYHSKEFAGKNAEFKVTVKKILEVTPVEINDELAVDLGCENLDDLKQKITGQMSQVYEISSKEKLKKDLFDYLENIRDFTVPEKMVMNEFDTLFQRAMEMKKENPNFSEGKTDEELSDVYKKLSKRRVVLGIMLAKVADSKNISVDPEDLREAVYNVARKYQGQENSIVNFYKKNPQAIEQLKAPIIEDKVVDFILTQVTLKEKKVTSEQFVEATKINPDGF